MWSSSLVVRFKDESEYKGRFYSILRTTCKSTQGPSPRLTSLRPPLPKSNWILIRRAKLARGSHADPRFIPLAVLPFSQAFCWSRTMRRTSQQNMHFNQKDSQHYKRKAEVVWSIGRLCFWWCHICWQSINLISWKSQGLRIRHTKVSWRWWGNKILS